MRRVTHCVVSPIRSLARFQHAPMDICNDGVGIHGEFCLREKSAATEQSNNEHTLKTTRILLRSTFQPAIVSLSFLACTNRMTLCLPLCLMTLFCISATVLRSIAWLVEELEMRHHRLDSHRQLSYRITHGLAEVVKFLSIHSPVEGSTDIGTG